MPGVCPGGGGVRWTVLELTATLSRHRQGITYLFCFVFVCVCGGGRGGGQLMVAILLTFTRHEISELLTFVKISLFPAV